MLDCTVTESIVGEGCILKDCQIQRSVLGIRSRVESGCVIDNALLMGADYYQTYAERLAVNNANDVPIGIGPNSTLRRTIVDKNARIGANVMIVNKDRVEEANREDEGFVIRNGIVVVVKNAVIPDGTVI